MPEATMYLTDSSGRAYLDLEESYRKEITARQSAFARNWNYYKGKHKKHLIDDGTNTDDNVVVNLIELLIDQGVSNLMGTTDQGAVKGPDFDVVTAETPDSAEPYEDGWLDKVWEVNEKALLLHDLAVNGGVCGTVYIKIVPDALPDPDGGLDSEGQPLMLPRLVVINPGNICAFWDAGDTSRVLWYRIQYGAEGVRRRQDIVRDVAEDGSDAGTWTIYDYVEGHGRTFNLAKVTAWPFSWPPIVEWKNLPNPNEHYGVDDVRVNGNLNDGLNFVASNIQRIIKHHATPKTIGTGIEAPPPNEEGQSMPTAIDGFFTTPSSDAKVYNLEMQSDLASSQAFMSWLRRSFFDAGREVDSSTIQDKLGSLTNFGLRVLFRNTLSKTGTKRLLYGAGLRRVCQHLLELGEFGPNIRIVDKWTDPLPSDPLMTAQALTLDRQNGLSQSTYLERRGFDPDVEAKQRENDIAEGVLGATLGRQGALVDSLRGNGTSGGSNGRG